MIFFKSLDFLEIYGTKKYNSLRVTSGVTWTHLLYIYICVCVCVCDYTNSDVKTSKMPKKIYN